MADLVYGQFNPRRFQFCVEDVAYDYPPAKFARLDSEDGLPGGSVKTLGLARQVVTPKPYNDRPWFAYESASAVQSSGGTATDYHANPRYIVQQVWRADWDQAFIDLCMRDHLYLLYSLQKAFWIQFDEEMSYDCARMESINAGRTAFITPTYPVAYYRASDTDGAIQSERAYYQVLLNGAPANWDLNPWRFDPEVGLLIFQTAIPSDVVVGIRYLWRAYVRIRELEFNISAYAQGPYNGYAVFEQIPVPYDVERFDTIMSRSPCRRCPDNKFSDGEDTEECTEYTSPATVASVARSGSTVSWTTPANAIEDDGAAASAVVTAGAKTDYLHATQFNFAGLPVDDLERKVVEIGVYVEAKGVLAGLFVDEVRVTRNGEVIGSNAADLEAILTSDFKFAYTLDVRDYGITYEDVLKARIGVAVGVVSQSGTPIIGSIDVVKAYVCYDEGIDNPPLPTSCGCNVIDKAATATVYEQTCLSWKGYQRASGFGVPVGNFVHGLEVASMNIGASNACAYPSKDAQVKVRARLNKSGFAFSDWLEKNVQPVAPTDHATTGYVDSTTDASFGGPNDRWGMLYGAWTPADVNAHGFELEVDWSTICDPQNPANWQVSYVYTGNTEHSAGQAGDPISFAWGQYPQGDLRDYSRGPGTPCYVTVAGTVKIVYTWIGAGAAPAFVRASIYSKAVAQALDGAGAGYWSGSVVNGFADDTAITYDSGYESARVQEGIHALLLDVVDGVASYDVVCNAQSTKTQSTSEGSQVYAGVLVTGEVDDCALPVAQPVIVRVHHSPVCATRALCHQNADESGTWNRPNAKGVNCELMQTSDGATNGNFALDMYDYPIETFKANTRVVGIVVTGEYRRVGSTSPGGTMQVIPHFGSYDGARTGKTLAYPTSSTFVPFTLGASGDYWDYAYADPDSGQTVPTAIGSQVNAYMHVQLKGANVNGTFFEFRNVKVTVYFSEVCDGL